HTELAAEFPAQLSHRSAISSPVFALMRACFNYGDGSKQFSHILRILHHRHFSQLHVQYLEGIIFRKKCHLDAEISEPYEPFGTFSDATGYAGFIPSSSWLCTIYDDFIEEHKAQIDQKCAMGSAEICSIDHSHKITKQIAKVNGEPVFTAALTVTNEYGEIRVLAFVATKAHSEFEAALEKMRDSLTLYGNPQPLIFYTDNPAADKHFLEAVFPSLTKEIVPIQKYPALDTFKLSPDTLVTVHDSIAGISSLDAEFNVIMTRTRGMGGGPQPTSILQVAYKNRVDIFQIGALKGDFPIALRTFLSNPQILKAGRGVKQDLPRLEKECKSPVPFTPTAVELAPLAKAKNVIPDARLGLADISAAVLRLRLDKSIPARMHSNWDAAALSQEQIQYAACDAMVSLLIYQALFSITLPGTVTKSTLPGTSVSILQNDSQVIAHGILSRDVGITHIRGIKITPTRAHVSIQEILVPGAILAIHGVPLSSLTTLPTDVLVAHSKLRTRTELQNPNTVTGQGHGSADMSTTLRPSGASSQPLEEPTNEVINLLSRTVPPDENWLEDVDDPPDGADTRDLPLPSSDGVVASVDEQSVQQGVHALPLPPSPSSWRNIIHSRVLMDPWHAMARIRVAKNHGFRRAFAQALRDAIFIPDEADRKKISDYLDSIGSSYDEILRFKAHWIWKRCKRIIPPPEQLYLAVQEIYSTFGPLKDTTTGLPLFGPHQWKDAANILTAIQAGWLSDPPGVTLYYRMGFESKTGLPLYRCARGTNDAEGGVHHSGRRHLPISGCSPRHASARLTDFVLQHNLMVGTFNHTGSVYAGHYDVWLTNQEQRLVDETQSLVPNSPALVGWVNGDMYTPSGETTGILRLPDITRATAEIQSYIHDSDSKYRHHFLAERQGTKYAIISVHTIAKKKLFKELMQEHFTASSVPNWKQAILIWNRAADGKSIFYKLVEHLQAYYNKWKKNVNEKNSLAQMLSRIRELEQKYRHTARSAGAPAVLDREPEVLGALLGGLPDIPPLIDYQDQPDLHHTSPPSSPLATADLLSHSMAAMAVHTPDTIPSPPPLPTEPFWFPEAGPSTMQGVLDAVYRHAPTPIPSLAGQHNPSRKRARAEDEGQTTKKVRKKEPERMLESMIALYGPEGPHAIDLGRIWREISAPWNEKRGQGLGQTTVSAIEARGFSLLIAG
ncbi:hypothetical protein HWV62_21994, partial [Athelia sp. TMB]